MQESLSTEDEERQSLQRKYDITTGFYDILDLGDSGSCLSHHTASAKHKKREGSLSIS